MSKVSEGIMRGLQEAVKYSKGNLKVRKIKRSFITRNEKPAAKLVSSKFDKVAAMESLFGIIPQDVDIDAVRIERILKRT